MSPLEEKIRRLPPDAQRQVEQFVDSLVERQKNKPAGTLKLRWRGALRDLRDKYTSVELQHKVLEWWGD